MRINEQKYISICHRGREKGGRGRVSKKECPSFLSVTEVFSPHVPTEGRCIDMPVMTLVPCYQIINVPEVYKAGEGLHGYIKLSVCVRTILRKMRGMFLLAYRILSREEHITVLIFAAYSSTFI
ncbi:MAG: hypothetical protein DRN07_00355 [Thermoplasmata archaeon]|nr:MAG: hypothetical protein DRN07_00355 [Thermoplasmata archaeon]